MKQTTGDAAEWIHYYMISIATLIARTEMSDHELAARLCVHQRSVYRWRLGQATPIPSLRRRLASIARVSVDDVDWRTGADDAI